MAVSKKVAQTVIKEDKFYTISAANGKVVEVADYNTEDAPASSCGITPMPNGSSGTSSVRAKVSTASRTASPARCWTCTRAAWPTAPLCISGRVLPPAASCGSWKRQ